MILRCRLCGAWVFTFEGRVLHTLGHVILVQLSAVF